MQSIEFDIRSFLQFLFSFHSVRRMLHTFSKLLRITSLLIRLAVLLAMFQLVGANSKTLLVAADNCYVNTKIVGGEDARCSVLEIDRFFVLFMKC